MKKTYVTPVMREEMFQAEEYVAACWMVACARPGTPYYDEGNTLTHMKYDGGKGCGHAENQVIGENKDGTVTMIEKDVLGQPDLPCTITTSGWQKTTLNASDVEIGNTIYWTTTSEDGKRTWHHWGTIQAAGGADANHS